jgi:hypothetical protein
MDLFHRIPGAPERLTATTAVVRLVDGLGFRLRWATESLTDADYRFRPAPASRSIGEIVEHVWDLASWVSRSVGLPRLSRAAGFDAVRASAIEAIFALRTALAAMSDADLSQVTVSGRPFWHLLNGPIADALTHVGQINTLRRLAGNPTPNANVFEGSPPPLS